MALELTIVDSKEIEEILNEKNPRKLHKMAAETIRKITKLQGQDPEGSALAFIAIVLTANFLESRAMYLALKEAEQIK